MVSWLKTIARLFILRAVSALIRAVIDSAVDTPSAEEPDEFRGFILVVLERRKRRRPGKGSRNSVLFDLILGVVANLICDVIKEILKTLCYLFGL